MMRLNIAGSSPYDPLIGFSRAVRVGNAVYVAGTGPVGADRAGVAEQARCVLGVVEAQAGLAREHVVCTRIYLTDADDWEEVGGCMASSAALSGLRLR